MDFGEPALDLDKIIEGRYETALESKLEKEDFNLYYLKPLPQNFFIRGYKAKTYLTKLLNNYLHHLDLEISTNGLIETILSASTILKREHLQKSLKRCKQNGHQNSNYAKEVGRLLQSKQIYIYHTLALRCRLRETMKAFEAKESKESNSEKEEDDS